MRGTRYLGAALCVPLLLGATACGDDDDEATTSQTATTVAEGPTSIEVTLTSDGIEGMPEEVPAGLVEITLVNETGDHGSLDITRVTAGTTEDEFVEGLAPLFQGGPFPDFMESNAGVDAEGGETETSTVVLSEGEHIAWFEGGSGGEEEPEETETETATETETETETEADEPTTTVAEEETTTTTEAEETTTTAEQEQGAAAPGTPEGTLTAVAAEDDAETTDDSSVSDPAEEEEPLAEEPEGGEGEGPGGPEIFTASLMVTAGDDAAELPEADGEIVAKEYEFEATLDGPGTINFRNDGPEQFHHAVVMDFGSNDPAVVEEAFPAILESEGDPSALPEIEGLDIEDVNFDFGGSGVFGPDGAGTFDADIVEGNTYVLVCFIQDRTGGPPHAIAHDMWDVVQAGGGGDATTTTEG